MTFWIVIAILTAAVGLLLLQALLRRTDDGRDAADFDIAVYRDQLAEVERDLARGVVSAETAERTRIEVSRRILEADKARAAAAGTRAPSGATWALVAVCAAVLVGGTAATYAWLGAPGYGDLPLKVRLEASEAFRENRPSQRDAEAQADASRPEFQVDPRHEDLVRRLRVTLAERGTDAEGLRLLARNEAALGNFAAAYAAQEQLIQVLGDAVQPSDYSDYADLMVLAAGGYVSPEAEAVLRVALERDPDNGPGRYYVGLMYAQTGRPDLAFQIWRQLLNDSAPDDPWVEPLREQLPTQAARAGIRYDLPPRADAPALPGPSREDMAAAADMSPEDRMQMIRGMVDNLSDRLASTGGSPEEWSRLITALGVLGDDRQARAIWDESRGVFAGNDDALAELESAARRAGLLQ